MHCLNLSSREAQIDLLLDSPSLADNLAGLFMQENPSLSLHAAHKEADAAVDRLAVYVSLTSA